MLFVFLVLSQVGLSRAKVRENLLVMQAFSPALFGHGPPPGPHILLQLLRGCLSPEQVESEFERLLEEKRAQGCENNLMDMYWECKAPNTRQSTYVHLTIH